MKDTFTQQDIAFFKDIGLTEEDVYSQLALFEKGSNFIQIDRPATANDGIWVLSEEEKNDFVSLFEARKSSYSLSRFIPASGLATRMFKFLHYFLDAYSPTKETLRSYLNREKSYKLAIFLGGLEKFPFYKQIKAAVYSNGQGQFQSDYRYQLISMAIEMMGELPKALIPFHEYEKEIRTAAVEQLYFSKEFIVNNQAMNVHFSIAPNATKMFEQALSSAIAHFEQTFSVQTRIVFSHQKRNTDTIAVLQDNTPYRQKDGLPFFRASGHGALLDNMQDMDEQIIFLSNIDNVSINKYHKHAAFYKKMLGGILIRLLENIYAYCRAFDMNKKIDLNEVKTFVQDKLHVDVPTFESDEKLADFLYQKLNRPVRVCGMVKNEGEPGGGPFWVRKGEQVSLQIVEGAQVSTDNQHQKNMFSTSTHFNPVDIVCAIHDFKGKKFNLRNFVDQDSYFITHKSTGNVEIKTLERPGLWNGSMADWNTIFVEVPVRTFNPVKTVNDLLRPMHQSE